VRIDALDRAGGSRLDEGFFVESDDQGAERTWCDAAGSILLEFDEEAGVPTEIGLRLWSPVPRRVVVTPGDAAPLELRVDGSTLADITVAGERHDVINNAGSRLVAGGFSADRGLYQLDAGQFDEPTEIAFFYGGAVVLRREFLDDVGNFDERLFLYYEDTDLSWRGLLRRWRFRYVPTSVVRHRHAASSGLGTPLFRFQNDRNRLLVLLKCAPLRVASRAYGVAVKQLLTSLVHWLASAVAWRKSARQRRTDLALRVRVVCSAVAGAPAMLLARRRLRATVPFSEPMRWAEPMRSAAPR
jgi:hypothetical protein